jgi:hypothetical protein
MVDVDWAMKQLSSIYRSEKHFQVSLGAKLAQMYGEERVRLEWNPATGDKIDIGVRRENATIPIELKHKTHRATVEDSAFGETIDLSYHSAHDTAHYRLLEDVRRVERIVEEKGRYGYVIFLTNDSNYWTDSGRDAIYDNMRVHEGSTLQGTVHWTNLDASWRKKDKWNDPIELSGVYQTEWSDYNYRDSISVSENPRFRYLIFRIG